MSTQNLGVVTAYGYAKEKGYTGTLEQFKQLMYDVSQSQGEINRLDGEIGDLKEDIKDNYAKNDGYYDGMTVGNAEQIVGTVFEEDDTAYNRRTTGGSAEVGDRAYVDAIVGGSLPWNQLARELNSTNWDSESGVTATYSNDIATISTISTNNGIRCGTLKFQKDHIYFLSCDFKAETALTYRYGFNNTDVYFDYVSPGSDSSWISKNRICKSTGDTTAYIYCYGVGLYSNLQIKNPQFFDLTAMFGSTIADYIYALETAHAGDGVAWFRRYFPKPYYAYHAVGMEHVNAVAAKTVGFNQWDEEWEVGGYSDSTGEKILGSAKIRNKNPIKCLPNTTYLFTGIGAYQSWIALYWYDADENFIGASTISAVNNTFVTPQNAAYMCWNTSDLYGTTYNHDICISIRWDNSRDGDYEPYNLHTYPLANLTLRGIPLIDESGNLKFDGDIYPPSGGVGRRYAEVDLGDFVWNAYPNKAGAFYTNTPIDCPTVGSDSIQIKGIMSKYDPATGVTQFVQRLDDKTYAIGGTSCRIYIYDSAHESSTTAQFKTAVTGVKFVYPLATPTTEEADPYQYPMVVDNWGTEELIDGLVESGDRDVAIPVGHETKYPPNLKDKLESAANNPDADGAYVLTHDGGSNTYTPLASNPTIQNIIARLEALEGGGE